MGQLIFEKTVKISNREKTVFSINGAGKIDIHMQKNEIVVFPFYYD